MIKQWCSARIPSQNVTYTITAKSVAEDAGAATHKHSNMARHETRRDGKTGASLRQKRLHTPSSWKEVATSGRQSQRPGTSPLQPVRQISYTSTSRQFPCPASSKALIYSLHTRLSASTHTNTHMHCNVPVSDSESYDESASSPRLSVRTSNTMQAASATILQVHSASECLQHREMFGGKIGRVVGGLEEGREGHDQACIRSHPRPDTLDMLYTIESACKFENHIWYISR